MQRVVFDANVWVSAGAYPGSVPDQVLDLARQGVILSILSDELIDQVRRALRSPRITVSIEQVELAEAEMRELSELIAPGIRLSVVTTKESDNRVLECAPSRAGRT